ncbi:PQQ-binding-like beta-propeller repeat protein [Candidatus Latescibacterota bacterium]
MKKINRLVAIIAGLLILISVNVVFAQNWPQWRGPLGIGSAPDGNPPIEWSEQQNIRWKTPLPGSGISTPVIWGNDIFITAAISTGKTQSSANSIKHTEPVKFIVLAVDRLSGKIKWERTAREAVPHEGLHPSTKWASSSPCTDGKRVYAFFGSNGLYCYSIEGELLWERDLGNMNIVMEIGEGSSPALYKDRLIVNWDHEGQSFIVALDTSTGEIIWKKNRDEKTTWATPIVVEVEGQPQIITSGTNRVRSYNLSNGDLIWEDDGVTENAIPSPLASDGILYVTSGYNGNILRAIRLAGAKGDISGSSAILWSYNKDTPYTSSPLLLGNLLYFLKHNNGILTCLDISTGKANYSNQRLDGISGVYSSPAGVRDRVYVLGRDGVTVVVRNGSEFNVIAKNTLDDKFDSSPAITGDEIFLRGYNYLYCIGRE